MYDYGSVLQRRSLTTKAACATYEIPKGSRGKSFASQITLQLRSIMGAIQCLLALSTDKCCESRVSSKPGCGDDGLRRGELMPDFGGVSSFIGVIEPLGGTGILISSGEPGMISGESSGIFTLEASLL